MPRKIKNPFSFPDLELDPPIRNFFTLLDEARLTLSLLAGMGSDVLRIAKVDANGKLQTGDATAQTSLATIADRLYASGASAASCLVSITTSASLVAARLLDGANSAAHLIAHLEALLGGGTTGPLTEMAGALSGISAATSSIAATLDNLYNIINDCYNSGTHALKTDEVA